MTDAYDNPFERYSYKSDLIEQIRAADGRARFGRVTVRTARSFGFCWGVDRAVAMVWDTLRDHPDRPIWLLDQIIHNPRVNADFKDKGVRFIRGPFAVDDGGPSEPKRDDIVVIPAFSATVEDTRWLQGIGCTIVDTTCPWVIKPHKRSQRYVKDGFTTLIHGLVHHEETRASCSLIASEGGRFVVVADREQSAWVCEAIRGSLTFEELSRLLPDDALSDGFAEEHLHQLGTINQTTMLAAETRQIEADVRAAMGERHADDDINDHFRELNTICGATQDNQDSVVALVEEGVLDLMVVVGGYDSSNTRNLTRVGRDHFPSYHVDGPGVIESHSIRHRSEKGEFVDTLDWLPAGDVTIGFTAGASTPDALLAETIARVLSVAGESLEVAS